MRLSLVREYVEGENGASFQATSLIMMENVVEKVADLGVVFHPGSYLRDFWNVMDCVVVVCAVSSFLFEQK